MSVETSHRTATSTDAHIKAFGDTWGHEWEQAMALRRHLILQHSYRPEDFGKPYGEFKINRPASSTHYMKHARIHIELYPMGRDRP